MITDHQAIEAARAYQKHGTATKAAEALGLARSTFRGRYTAFKERGLKLVNKVILADERVVKVRHRKVSEQEKAHFFQTYGMVYNGPNEIPVHDKRGKKILDQVGAQIVLEGRALDLAVRRAARWMKNNPPGTNKRMPRHIEMGARAMEQLERV